MQPFGSSETTRRRMKAPLGLALAALLAGIAACEPEPEPVEEPGAPAVVVTPPPAEVIPTGPAAEDEVAVRLVEWDVEMSRDTIPAGPVTFRVVNAGTTHHAFEVEGQGIEEETEHLQPGDSATLSVNLQPGRYTVYCPVVDEVSHREQGMVDTLYVR